MKLISVYYSFSSYRVVLIIHLELPNAVLYHEAIPIVTSIYFNSENGRSGIWVCIKRIFEFLSRRVSWLITSCILCQRRAIAAEGSEEKWHEPSDLAEEIQGGKRKEKENSFTSLYEAAELRTRSVFPHQMKGIWSCGNSSMKGIGTWSVHIVFSISRSALGLCGVNDFVSVISIYLYYFFLYLVTTSSSNLTEEKIVSEEFEVLIFSGGRDSFERIGSVWSSVKK